MRIALALAIVVTVGCSGSSNMAPTLTMVGPAANALLGPGAIVQIDYADDDGDSVALTDLYADVDGDLATTADQIAIAAARADGNGATQTVFWDTTGVASATYAIVGVTDDGTNDPVVSVAAGLVTLNFAPTVSVSGPAASVEVRVNTPVTVAYADDDPDDTASTDLYADVDGDPATTGDRYEIGTLRPDQGGATQSLDWDTSGVPAGTYRVVAVTTDGTHAAVTAMAPGMVTIVDPGNAIELLGDGGHVTFTEPLLGDRTTFTFEMWIKLSYPPIAGAPQPTRNLIYVESYVGGGPLNGAQRNFTFVSLNDDGTPDEPGAILMVSWPNDGLSYPFTDPAPEEEWMHLAFVREASVLRIYINGTLAAEGGALTYTGPTPTEFHLGLFVNPVSGNEWGKFTVDEMRVSSVARYSAAFVPALAFEPDASTVSLWHFDEAAGTATSDAAGNATDGVLSAQATRVTADR